MFPEKPVVLIDLLFPPKALPEVRFCLDPREDVDTLEPNLSRRNALWQRGDQVHDRKGGDGLPAPALPYEAEDLAFLNLEIHTVRGTDHAARRQELRPKPSDREQGRRRRSPPESRIEHVAETVA